MAASDTMEGMGALTALPERRQSMGEEIANSISHGVGLVAGALAAPVLIYAAVRRGDPPFIVGACIFAATIVLMYLSSTLYHALPENRAKRVFRVIDHGSIYLLIAGTYSPFTLGMLPNAWGWTLFGIVWGLAVLGIAMKSTGRAWHPIVSTGLYLLMGWLAVIAVRPIFAHLPTASIAWLAAGGVAYTIGVGFYAARRLRYGHFVWHLFVVAGTACHIVAVIECTL
jgi:hemolysin III